MRKIIKHSIKTLFRSLGFDIHRIQVPAEEPKTIRTNELELYETATGKYYLPKDAKADWVAMVIKQNQIFDEAVYNLAASYIKEGTIALDVGSNFGQMAVLYSRHVGADGLVYAFEANHFVYGILEKNIAINNARVKAFEGAVHNVDGETLYFPEYVFDTCGTYGSFGIDYATSKGEPVNAFTLDSLDYPLPVSFMKVDVQGGDLFAMQGARGIIEKYKMPIIFEYEPSLEVKQNFNFQQYVDFVDSINYTFVRVVDGHNYLILPR